ncbi:MAG: RibD family protein [Clostridiales bacterium]|nr:RibD family protein [Clostridiales bacterium]
MRKKPFVVCHMLASLDGKIDGAFFGMPETAPALKAYGDLRGFYGCPAILYGTTTMLGDYADGRISNLPNDSRSLSKNDWINSDGKAADNFIISVDPKGELAFSSPYIEKKGRPAAHVIEVLTEQASPAYLAYLQGRGISYIFAGKRRLNCILLLEKLQEMFGIDKLMVAGGGITNWSFLQEDLIDELSLVIAPVADGSTQAVSIFEWADFLDKNVPKAFLLKDAKALEGNVLWLRYDFIH